MAFADPDGDNLNYEATLDNNNSLPNWISFNESNLEFNGIAPRNGTF